MGDDELKRLSSISNYKIKKSTITQNRFWRKETINKVRKMIRDDMKDDLIKIDSFNNKGSKNGSKDS